jgi:hypothetical protein
MNKIIKNKNYYKKMMKFSLIWNVALAIVILGVIMNFVALTNNGCKMPFIADYEYESETHFSYKDKGEVNHWYLTDIISMSKDELTISIGDFLIVIGGALVIGFSIIFVTYLYRIKKGVKE